MDVVPTTSVQSATAASTLGYSRALSSIAPARTAERASRKATSYAFTRRRSVNPKLLMARAAAPMFSGLRGATRMIRRFAALALTACPELARKRRTPDHPDCGRDRHQRPALAAG